MIRETTDGLPALGFLGLGSMGSGMARNLLKAGYRVLAFDKSPERLAAAVKEGATPAGDEDEVVAGADVILTSLPSSAVLVSIADGHFIPTARAGQVFIDLGTTEAPEVRRIARALAERGAALLDCPVSGGSAGADAGSLRIFVGGDRAVADRCRRILEVLGDPERVVYCGPSGSGQAVKAVNQLAMGLADAAYLEAVAFGVQAGVDPAAIVRAVGGPTGWRGYFASMAQRVAEGRGDDVLVKYPELPYFLREARERGFQTPLTRALCDYLREARCDWVDNMGRPRPSLWNELTRERDT